MKKRKIRLPHLKHEMELWEKGYLVVGIDEVGRGAFAGPLVLGGVVLEPMKDNSKIKEFERIGINDSKKLPARKREELNKIIKKEAKFCCYASINVQTINKVGIGKATYIAVRKIVKQILKRTESEKRLFVLMDAFYVKYIKGVGLANQKAIVHGDEISLSIAAASIIAKVKRDNFMVKMNDKYEGYNFHLNKGYGTADHRKAIRRLGITEIHRKAYVRKLLITNF